MAQRSMTIRKLNASGVDLATADAATSGARMERRRIRQELDQLRPVMSLLYPRPVGTPWNEVVRRLDDYARRRAEGKF